MKSMDNYAEMGDGEKRDHFVLFNKDTKMDSVTKTQLLESSWWTGDEDWALNNQQ